MQKKGLSFLCSDILFGPPSVFVPVQGACWKRNFILINLHIKTIYFDICPPASWSSSPYSCRPLFLRTNITSFI